MAPPQLSAPPVASRRPGKPTGLRADLGHFDDGAFSVSCWERSDSEAARFAWLRRCTKLEELKAEEQLSLDVELLGRRRR